MTPRQAAVLASPGLVLLAVAVPVWLLAGTGHLAAAGVGVGLTVPAAYGTFWLTRWLADRHPQGVVIGMFVGTALRMGLAFVGGAVVFLLTPPFREMVLGYWVWVLFAYLATLVTETALLVRVAPAGAVREGKG